MSMLRGVCSKIGGALLTVLATTVWSGGIAGSASAAPDDRAPDRVAVITPLLDLFQFGNEVGLALLCPTLVGGAAGGLQNVAPAMSGQFGAVAGEVVTHCAEFSRQGSVHLQEGKHHVAPLAAINPAVNPFIHLTAALFSETGKEFGPSLAPFGPTVTALGQTITWFAGSDSR